MVRSFLVRIASPAHITVWGDRVYPHSRCRRHRSSGAPGRPGL